MEFKIGDKVKYVGDTEYVGKGEPGCRSRWDDVLDRPTIYTVKDIWGTCIDIGLEDKRHGDLIHSTRFKKVTEQQEKKKEEVTIMKDHKSFEPGDKIRRIDNSGVLDCHLKVGQVCTFKRYLNADKTSVLLEESTNDYDYFDSKRFEFVSSTTRFTIPKFKAGDQVKIKNLPAGFISTSGCLFAEDMVGYCGKKFIIAEEFRKDYFVLRDGIQKLTYSFVPEFFDLVDNSLERLVEEANAAIEQAKQAVEKLPKDNEGLRWSACGEGGFIITKQRHFTGSYKLALNKPKFAPFQISNGTVKLEDGYLHVGCQKIPLDGAKCLLKALIADNKANAVYAHQSSQWVAIATRKGITYLDYTISWESAIKIFDALKEAGV